MAPAPEMMLPVLFMLLQSPTCPWLNAATAGGFLGTAMTASVSEGSCTFTGGQQRLTITVASSSHLGACGPNVAPLKAIGNEAVVCSAPGDSTKVIGRVRDQVFTVLITTTDREKARAVAEQVAGILF